MKHLVTLLVSTSLLFLACEKQPLSNGAEILVEELSIYFPLHVGDEWDYLSGMSVRTDTIIKIDGEEYYRFISESEFFVDTSYFRNDNDVIYKANQDGHAYKYFDLNAMENEKWEMKFNKDHEYPYHVQITDKSFEYESPNNTYESCYFFDFDIPMIVDEEFQIVLAPNFGVVWEQTAWVNVRSGLLRTVIDGKETIF